MDPLSNHIDGKTNLSAKFTPNEIVSNEEIKEFFENLSQESLGLTDL